MELLQGRLSQGVMEIITHREQRPVSQAAGDRAGLFLPRLGGHVQARGGGALRRGGAAGREAGTAVCAAPGGSPGTDRAGRRGPASAPAAGSDKKTIAEGDLAEVFGIEMDTVVPSSAAPSPARNAAAKGGAKAAAKAGVRRPPRLNLADLLPEGAARSRRSLWPLPAAGSGPMNSPLARPSAVPAHLKRQLARRESPKAK